MKMCDSCGENPASILLTQIEGDTSRTKHICFDCAEKMGLNIDQAPEEDDFDETLSAEDDYAEKKTPPQRVCPLCGTTEKSFTETWQAGCSECYNTFEPIIAERLSVEKGDTFYHGKNYTHGSGHGSYTAVESLRRELDRAVRTQKYELAALLRDRINRMEAGR
ncbi:MAG: UvrB/UvrC motif-containing protein [Fibrobacterota bacterium]